MRHLAVLMLLTLVAGCSSWPWRAALPELPLLPPGALGQQWQLSQSVTLSPLQQPAPNTPAQHTLLAAWSVTQDRLDLAGLTLAGQTLLTLSYDGRELHMQRSPLLPAEVSPRDILVQLQLSYWPMDSITRAFKGGPWRMEQHNGVRELFLQQRRVLTIERTASQATDTVLGRSGEGALESFTLTHHLMHYRLQIQTLTRDAIGGGDSPVTPAVP